MSQVAVTNLLNLTVGASIFIDYEILELHQLENKLSASIFLFCERYFTLANSMVMALVVVDRFLAIRFDMKYTAGWRTKRRIICSIIFCWLSLLLLILLDLTINNPNLGKVPVWKYKLATSNTVYFDSVKAVFPVAFMMLTILTWRSLKKQKKCRQASWRQEKCSDRKRRDESCKNDCNNCGLLQLLHWTLNPLSTVE